LFGGISTSMMPPGRADWFKLAFLMIPAPAAEFVEFWMLKYARRRESQRIA